VSARAVARDHPHRWAATGLPDSLAPLDISMQTTWAAVQLALSGADHDTLARTLGLTDQTARHIIIATTEQLVVTRHAAPSTPTPSTPTPSTPAPLSGLRIDPLSCQIQQWGH
jgi:hypothetical protein